MDKKCNHDITEYTVQRLHGFACCLQSYLFGLVVRKKALTTRKSIPKTND